MVKKPPQFWLRAVILTIVGMFLFYVLPLATPFLLSIILAILLWPLVNIIEHALKNRFGLTWMPRWLAIIPTYLIFTLVIVVVMKFIFIPFATQFTKFLNNVPNYMDQFMVVINQLQANYLNQKMPPQFIMVVNETITKIGNYTVLLAQKALQTVFTFAGFLVELLLVPIITFYMLKDGRKIVHSFENLFEGETKHRISIVLNKIYKTLSGYIIGQLFLAINMFIIVFIMMSLLQIPYPLVLALIAAIAEWIPIIGPIVGATPAIVLAATISVPLAIKVAIFYILIQLFDAQITMPRIFGKFIRLHPIAIIGAVFIGGTLYGIKGMLLAVPVTAILKIIANHLWYFETSKGDIVHHERRE